MNKPDGYVTKADSSQIRVVASNQLLIDELNKIGFIFDNDLLSFVIQTKDNNEKAIIFDKLRGLGVCFSSGREWSPSELFEYFREIKLVSGTYKRISWDGPNSWKVSES